METRDLAELLTLINALWGTFVALLGLNYPTDVKAITMLVVIASILIPLSISIRERHKKLPLFPFIPLRFYVAFIAIITVLQCTEAVLLLYIGIVYWIIFFPVIQLIPLTYTILISALFSCIIALGIAMFIIALLRLRALRNSPKIDLAKELKGLK